MVTTHNLGFPRIGSQREFKFALESYWKGETSREELETIAAYLRKTHWMCQSKLDFVPVGDFSFYDHMLDMTFLLGNLPSRAKDFKGHTLDNYFRLARGKSAPGNNQDAENKGIAAGEMTKWFDTNYHYLVPEFESNTTFNLDPTRLLTQLAEAKATGIIPKPVLVGPLTYLALGKTKDGTVKLALLPSLLAIYAELLTLLEKNGIKWVQIDEPILVTDLDSEWKAAFEQAYQTFSHHKIKILLTSYFGPLLENIPLLCQLPVAGIHIDGINAKNEIETIIDRLPDDRILSIGVINGRNIWKTDLNSVLDWLEPIAQQLEDRLWIAPTCSLLHVPIDLNSEQKMDEEIKAWLAFGVQKLEELTILANALNQGRQSVQQVLDDNHKAILARRASTKVHHPEVKKALETLSTLSKDRHSPYSVRETIQANRFNLPLFPTTTIGSFPQTPDIRQVRKHYKAGQISALDYASAMQKEIAFCIQQQETLDLDVLVHGEPERNDMVEYFGEQLNGFIFTQCGWVQSYGSRCVKPPILFGDVSRPKPMTVDWSTYAQSLTKKPVKGMLTGPVTILNWSFVRDDQPRSVSCYQLALAIRDEVLDLEKAGIAIIQIDEAALREGLPLRQSQWKTYLNWAIDAFRITANGVKDETQIHTHMCYSEFNDIIASIADMDADVITIETSRSDMELLDAFEHFNYPNQIGPGVYDIHSPNIPRVSEIITLIKKASEYIPEERLWINPDCGLKTRQWSEVIPALTHMVVAAKTLRPAS